MVDYTRAVDKITKDKDLKAYFLSFGLKFFPERETLVKDLETHNRGFNLITGIKDIMRTTVVEEELPLVDCNINNIDKIKYKLVKQNIDAFATDINNFFVKAGLITVHNGASKSKDILFLTRENELFCAVYSYDTDTTCASHIILDKNKADIVHAFGSKEYIKRASTRIIPIPLHQMAEEKGLDNIALVLYINHIVTHKIIRPSSNKEYKPSLVPNKRGDYKPKEATEIPRVVYTLNPTGEITRSGYDRHKDSWLVTGHWRHYKSGKKVWINPYVKGEGELEQKKYKL